jgi:acyl-CoA thioesterase-1
MAVDNNITPIIGLPIPCDDLDVERLLQQYRKQLCE